MSCQTGIIYFMSALQEFIFHHGGSISFPLVPPSGSNFIVLTAERPLYFFPSDRGEQHLHPEEPVVPAGGGDALLSPPQQPGAGHPPGLLLSHQGAGLPLLGQEEARQEAGRLARRQGTK